MAVAMCTSMAKTEAKIKEGNLNQWKAMFPEFATLEGSCSFIKKIIAISVSAITYLREIFPDDAYGEKDLCGIKLKILSETTKYKSITKFIELIRSCYDAVEKKYICTNPMDREEVVESYTFVFKYKDDVCSVTTNNKKSKFSPKQGDPTVDATLLMLKSILTVNELVRKLPENIYLTLKLLYYDDVTPSDYEPPGFEPASYAQFSFPEETMKLSLGKIATDYHGCQFLLKTSLKKSSLSQRSSEDPMMGPPKLSSLESQMEIASSQGSKSGKTNASNKLDDTLDCPCGLKLGEQANTIVCMSCEKRQHKTCYGIRVPDDIPQVFYCVECILLNSDGNSSLDLIYTFPEDKRQDFCQTRRALALALSLGMLSGVHLEKLLGCTKEESNFIISRLATEGYIEKRLGSLKYQLNTEYINRNGVQKYFPPREDFGKENLLSPDTTLTLDSAKLVISSEAKQLPIDMEDDHVESSIKKVKSLSLKGTTSKKRKCSSKSLTCDDSTELFQTPKRRRSRRAT